MDWTPPSDAVETKSKSVQGQDVTSSTKGGWTPPTDAVETKSTAIKQPYLKADGTIDPSWKRPDGSLKGPGWLGIVKSASG